MYQLKIPRQRIAVLIGKNGEVKKQIETETATSMNIDSKEGDIQITGEDGLGLYSAREVITAIARGFNPNVALLLLKGDHVLEKLELGDGTKTKEQLTRLKGRVIGTEGKCRRLIEELSGTYIAVYGKTIGIIGEPANVAIARKAIEQIIKGSMHNTVYRWLEKRRKELKAQQMMI